MKSLLILLLSISTLAQAKSISGSVFAQGKITKGTLYIFAKKFNSPMPMPLAVKKIPNPKFPVSFSLSAKDAMMKGIPFKGPFKVSARISPSGDPMDKTGIEVSTSKAVNIGDKKVNLVLKSK